MYRQVDNPYNRQNLKEKDMRGGTIMGAINAGDTAWVL